jgi:GxxExxY protein
MSEATVQNRDQAISNQISEKVIGSAFKVGTALGSGFLENVYENALLHELTKAGLKAKQQDRVVVKYDGLIVGDFLIDIVVEDFLILEIKAVRDISVAHHAQLLNYLKAARKCLGLILNFGGPSVQVVRKVHSF